MRRPDFFRVALGSLGLGFLLPKQVAPESFPIKLTKRMGPVVMSVEVARRLCPRCTYPYFGAALPGGRCREHADCPDCLDTGRSQTNAADPTAPCVPDLRINSGGIVSAFQTVQFPCPSCSNPGDLAGWMWDAPESPIALHDRFTEKGV